MIWICSVMVVTGLKKKTSEFDLRISFGSVARGLVYSAG